MPIRLGLIGSIINRVLVVHMDNADVLFEAYKESYIQARKTYRFTLLVAIFSLLVIVLVLRDSMLLKTAEPKMATFKVQIENLETELLDLNQVNFNAPKSFKNAKVKYEASLIKIEEWPNNLPARKKMKKKYEGYLSEYSGDHEQVMKRLRIDGEPGIELFEKLRDLILQSEKLKQKFSQVKKNMERDKEKFKAEQAKQRVTLETKIRRTAADMDTLQEDIRRIEQDRTRLPWLGLRVDPKDIMPFVPIFLLILFHILFDKFEDMIAILKNPHLKDFRAELKAFPVPVFLGRRSWYALFSIVMMFGLVPFVQLIAVILTVQHEIGSPSLGDQSWLWLSWIGGCSLVVTLLYPSVLFLRHRNEVLAYR